MAPRTFQKHKSRTTVICVPLFSSLSPTGCYFHLSLELYCFSGEKGNANSLCPWLQREVKIVMQLLFHCILKVHPVLDTISSAVKKKWSFSFSGQSFELVTIIIHILLIETRKVRLNMAKSLTQCQIFSKQQDILPEPYKFSNTKNYFAQDKCITNIPYHI